jgi:predicted DNA-binding transcriptional regulator AlpA
MTERLLRAEDIGEALGISRAGAFNLAKCGVIPCVKFKAKSGKGPRGDRFTIRFREQDLNDFIKSHLCDRRADVR